VPSSMISSSTAMVRASNRTGGRHARRWARALKYDQLEDMSLETRLRTTWFISSKAAMAATPDCGGAGRG